MSRLTRTVEELDLRRPTKASRSPGVLVVAAEGKPAAHALPVPKTGLALGRDLLDTLGISDPKVSREHATVRAGGRFVVEDHKSRNGTYVCGTRCGSEPVEIDCGSPIRVGQTLLVPVDPIEPYRAYPARVERDRVVGATLAKSLAELAALAPKATSLLIRGPSGAGKELFARSFHDLGPRPSGPFVAVNCATVPGALAERLLFGARAGAYSGAEPAAGYFEAANGGTLFLDEIAELDLGVQAKLLRVLETGEVLPLGATKPVRVDVRFCAATFRDLRAASAAERFRHDLYFRIAKAEVGVPPLCQRLEEIPWHVERTLRALQFTGRPHASFVEACLLRRWPGNIRELAGAVGRAVAACTAAGHEELSGEDLAADAGLEPLGDGDPPNPPTARPKALPSDPEVELALTKASGNVAAAARSLGVHRNQLRRWLARRG